MTTATNLIQAAYREGNLIAVGKQPTTNELAEALVRLNAFVKGIFGYEMGENLSDWLFPAPQRTGIVPTTFPQLPVPEYYGPLYSQFLAPYPPRNTRIVWGATT